MQPTTWDILMIISEIVKSNVGQAVRTRTQDDKRP